jgi:scyllo-inositol 2-dehydrogenase (NADP+)
MNAPPDEALRVAIIGYGLAGAVFHAPLISSTPGYEIRAIVTTNQGRRAAAERDFPHASILSSADEIWHDPSRYDLVIIATSNRSHASLGLAAIESGLPVVIDKPIAVTVDDAHRLITAATERAIPLTIFQNRRWDGDFMTVRSIIERDLLGPIVRYESRFERYRPVPRAGAWRESPDPEEGGGLLLDLGSHLIDGALVLFGRPLDVYAEVGTYRPGAAVDDDSFVALRFAGGIHAHLWMNTVVRTLGPRFHVSGLRGTYSKYGLDPQEPALKAGMRPGDSGWGLDPLESWGSLSTDLDGLHFDGSIETLPGSYQAFYAQLRDALHGDGPLPVDATESLATLQVIEAARQSARDHRVITLPPNPAASPA